MVYGLTLDNEREILSRAAIRKCGVYKFRGVGYRVVGGKVTHYAYGGNVLERCFGFNCIVGTYSGHLSNGTKILRGIE